MKIGKNKAPFALVLLLLVSCEPVPLLDTQPPQWGSTQRNADGSLTLTFSEDLAKAGVRLTDPSKNLECRTEGRNLRFSLPDDLTPGRQYTYTVEVEDPNGNATTLNKTFYARNPQPVPLFLSEVRIAGSGTKPDAVELVALADGRLGGITLECIDYNGSSQTKVFPDVSLTKGDFVVLHCKPQGTTEEVDEVDSPSQSGGYEVRPATWDFWLPDGKGLSGTTGLLVLKEAPDGAVQEILAWSPKEGAALKLLPPEDQPVLWTGKELLPTACTSTRTWCRIQEPAAWGGTSGPGDWMLVATSCSTMGYANKLTPYVPGK